MIQKIDSNKFSLTILKVTTFSRIRQGEVEHLAVLCLLYEKNAENDNMPLIEEVKNSGI